jgi:CubicO group peptidase (beta-lactamase class C family)
MLLVHDGKLSYDTPLSRIFPEFPAYGRSVTIRHLLTHTGGLPDYEELMDEAEKAHGPTWTATRQIQDQEVLALLEGQKEPKFAAGTSWSYSNSGYVVLGLVVAKISGKPFRQFLRQRIFSPLHMDRTLAFVNGTNTVPDRAYGHTKTAEGFSETDQSPTSATLGDGGIYSNLDDLAKWDAALRSHALLSVREIQPALTPVRLKDGSQPKWPAAPGEDNLDPGKPVSYGFGWFMDPYEGRPRMWHTGTSTGFRTVIERFPAQALTVVVLSNRTDIDPDKLALRVAGLLFNKETAMHSGGGYTGRSSGMGPHGA